MKAAQITSYGGAEVLQTTDQATRPTIEPDQVLVEAAAASLNPFDYKIRDGLFQQMIPLDLPATLGGDVAGAVAEVGSEVTDFAVGDEVYGMGNAVSGRGSYAEFVPVKASSLAVKPNSVDFITAAAFPLAAVSAYQGLVEHINLQPGQKILIHGGAGGIGALAIQIAKHLGAYVTTTVSAKDLDHVKELGADEVIDYQAQDFAEIIHDYDAVFDTVGGETTEKSYGVLKPGGILVSMASYQADEALAERYKVQFIPESTNTTTEKLAAIAALIDDGTLSINIDKVFPLDEAGQALEYLKTGHPRGKVVLQIK